MRSPGRHVPLARRERGDHRGRERHKQALELDRGGRVRRGDPGRGGQGGHGRHSLGQARRHEDPGREAAQRVARLLGALVCALRADTRAHGHFQGQEDEARRAGLQRRHLRRRQRAHVLLGRERKVLQGADYQNLSEYHKRKHEILKLNRKIIIES